jgi:MFS family permease
LSGIPALYFLPVYFQAVLNSTPARAGVQLLPTVLGILPGAIVSGFVLTKFGRYKPIQFVGFAFMTVGFGILLLLNDSPRPDQWIGYQLISAIGTGFVLPVSFTKMVLTRNLSVDAGPPTSYTSISQGS